MDVQLDPPQPEPVVEAIAAAIAPEGEPAVDPWWRAGVVENLHGEDYGE